MQSGIFPIIYVTAADREHTVQNGEIEQNDK